MKRLSSSAPPYGGLRLCGKHIWRGMRWVTVHVWLPVAIYLALWGTGLLRPAGYEGQAGSGEQGTAPRGLAGAVERGMRAAIRKEIEETFAETLNAMQEQCGRFQQYAIREHREMRKRLDEVERQLHHGGTENTEKDEGGL